jgi:hypothetical protein
LRAQHAALPDKFADGVGVFAGDVGILPAGPFLCDGGGGILKASDRCADESGGAAGGKARGPRRESLVIKMVVAHRFFS